MMECKKALTEADGDLARAEEILRVKLGNKAGKAASRITAEGVVTEAPSVEVSCDDTNISISAEGINEEVGEVTREMNAEGHNLTAAETELNVGVEGIAGEAPTQELEFEAASELSATENSITGDAMLSQEAAITMIE